MKKFILVISCFIFAFLSFYQLSLQEMEVVELLTSEVSKRDWNQLVFNRLRMGHPPLYFVLLKGWNTFFGFTPYTMYSLTILIGALGLPAIYFLAKELGLGRLACVAPLIWSVHPAVIFHTRYIRPQIGVAVLCAFMSVLLIRSFSRESFKERIALIVLIIIGALWSHLFLFFWSGILLASLSISAIRQSVSKGYWGTIAIAFVAQIFMLMLVRYYSGPVHGRLEWVEDPTPYTLFASFLKGLGPVNGKLFPFAWWSGALSLCACLSVALFTSSKEIVWKFSLLGAGYAVAFFLVLTFTYQAMWVPRYFVLILPFTIVAIVKMITYIRYIPSRPVATALIVVVTGWVTVALLPQRVLGLRKIIAALEEKYVPGDTVLVMNIMTREALRLYAQKDLDYFVIRRSVPHDQAFALIDKKLREKERLWVIEYPRKDSILTTDRWPPEQLYPLCKEREHKVRLYGYTHQP